MNRGPTNQREGKTSAAPSGLRNGRIAAEMLLMTGLLLAIDHVRGSGDSFTHVQPSPFWLPVLAMAVAYGSWAGLAAAALASIAWLANNTIDPAAFDYFGYVFAISLPPLLWSGAAVILGEVTDARRRTMRSLAAERAVGERNMARLIAAFHALAQNNRVLQLRITTEEATVSEALHIAARLPHVTGQERQAALRAMVAMACRTANFTCYRLQYARAWPVLFGDDSHRLRQPLPPALLAAMIERRTFLHVAHPADRALLAGAGVIAVPLLAPDATVDGTAAGTARLEGILLIHDLPFASLGPHLEADLAALAGWLTGFVAEHSMLGDLAVVRERV